MIWGLIIIGLLLIASALKNTVNELGAQLQIDLLGQSGFLTWIAAIGGVGALGYVPALRTTSRYLLALIIVVLVVRNGGIWANLQTALQTASAEGPAPSIPTPTPQLSSGSSASGSSGSSGSTAQTAEQVAAIAAIALA